MLLVVSQFNVSSTVFEGTNNSSIDTSSLMLWYLINLGFEITAKNMIHTFMFTHHGYVSDQHVGTIKLSPTTWTDWNFVILFTFATNNMTSTARNYGKISWDLSTHWTFNAWVFCWNFDIIFKTSLYLDNLKDYPLNFSEIFKRI